MGAMSAYFGPEGAGAEPEPRFWNRSAALKNIGGDENLLNEIIQAFLAASPSLLTQIEQAVCVNHAGMLELAAHTLKGQLGYLEAPDARETAHKLESAARNGKIEGTVELVAEMRTQLAELRAVLGGNVKT
jgi:HPt (histidine-containing phosphotransfer) domain-containing protein